MTPDGDLVKNLLPLEVSNNFCDVEFQLILVLICTDDVLLYIFRLSRLLRLLSVRFWGDREKFSRGLKNDTRRKTRVEQHGLTTWAIHE